MSKSERIHQLEVKLHETTAAHSKLVEMVVTIQTKLISVGILDTKGNAVPNTFGQSSFVNKIKHLEAANAILLEEYAKFLLSCDPPESTYTVHDKQTAIMDVVNHKLRGLGFQ